MSAPTGGLCHGKPHLTYLFFSEDLGDIARAKSFCAGCEVRADCLEYALVNGEKFGIWGGLSERERRRLRRQRALARRANRAVCNRSLVSSTCAGAQLPLLRMIVWQRFQRAGSAP